MDKCIVCGKPMEYVKTVRSRQLRKRWDIFRCTECKQEERKLK